MDEQKKNIEQILDQFAKEELGNRLSQFAIMSLKSLIMAELNKIIFAPNKKIEKSESNPMEES